MNALRTADTRLQRADPEYATRAGSNSAHFLLPRPRTDTTPREYAELTLRPGLGDQRASASMPGSTSARCRRPRGWPTSSSRRPSARRWRAQCWPTRVSRCTSCRTPSPPATSPGTWGDVSQRKGTHDYYNEAGLEVFAWKGSSDSMVLMGDAHMRPEDAERAAARSATSLEQLIDHASGRHGVALLPHTPGGAGRARRLRRLQEQRARAARRRPARHRRKRCAARGGSRARRRCRVSARGSARCRAFARRSGRSSDSPGRRLATSTAGSSSRSRRTAGSPTPTCRCARASASTA